MFSIQNYQNLIHKLLNSDLKPTTNWEDNLSPKTLLLRHDVDFSVDFAYQLAKVEFKLNINSTYFFMLSSNMYSLLSARNKSLVDDIAKMGHKISIHFDPTVYKNLDGFMNEKNIFEHTFERKVDIVSIHRPGPFLDNNNILLSGVPQTYLDIYYKKMKYISDSSGRDIFPLITKYLEGPKHLGLHLLVHPIWWMGIGKNPTETLNAWRDKKFDFITSEIRSNCRTYKD
jgi:hypothetical protein